MWKGKRGSKAKKEQKVERTKTTSKKKEGLKPTTIFIYAFALAAFGGGGFLLFNHLKRKKLVAQNLPNEATDTIIINNNLPASFTSSSSSQKKVSAANSKNAFPLKQGSRGALVKTLQEGLARILGSMTPFGGIDGIFGKGTAAALAKAGYPEVVDELTFNRITGSNISEAIVVFDPKALANELYNAANIKNAGAVLTALNKIKSVSEYSSVNDVYKLRSLLSGGTRMTIVTDLLDFSFVNNDDAKKMFRSEFARIGLKVDDTGRWSLQGFKLFKDLITLRETIVTDSRNNKIPVRKNTILGDELKIENGLTWFRSVDDTILSVPTQDIKYT